MRNRWLIALSAVGIHISIGSVYAWSVLTRPIMKEMGFSLAETTWTFSLAVLFLGFSAGFLGSFVEKIGPKRAASSPWRSSARACSARPTPSRRRA